LVVINATAFVGSNWLTSGGQIPGEIYQFLPIDNCRYLSCATPLGESLKFPLGEFLSLIIIIYMNAGH
jgi:hypothetical protein